MRFIFVVGNLGSDPEERVTPGGQKLWTFNLASNSRRKGQEETVWYRVTVWPGRLDGIMPHLKKGSFILVIGDVHEEIYENRDGMPQISRNITADSIRFIPGRAQGDRPAESQPFAAAPTTPSAAVNVNADDDLPF